MTERKSHGRALGQKPKTAPNAIKFIAPKVLSWDEFTAISLAELAGIYIPEIKLIDFENLDNLPPINLPDEKLAFAIKRFDRHVDTRIHM